MKFGREKYEVIQDTSLGRALASLVLATFRLGVAPPANKIEHARELSRSILGITEFDREPTCADVRRHEETQLRIPSDEPVFMIRAKDKNALEAVDAWINASIDAGVDSGLIHEAKMQRRRIEEWQRNHRTQAAT